MRSQNWFDMIVAGQTNDAAFEEAFPWAADMIGCPHDPVQHAEGDPWVHTKMVVGSLMKDPEYLKMPEDRRQVMRLAAWLHDIAKPATTEFVWSEEEDREKVSQPGHAPLGAKMAYQALVDLGVDIEIAREVHALVFWHQRPSHMTEGENTTNKRMILYPETAGRGSWHELLTLCRNDQRGRVSANAQKTLEDLDLIELMLEEHGDSIGCDLVHGRWPFETDEARLRYLRGPNDGSAFFMPADPDGSHIILMSGLPGAGKDTLIRECFSDFQVVSMDSIREEMGVKWDDNQGKVVQAAYEKARGFLRRKENFVWNATAPSRLMRQKISGLARDYGAIIEAVSIDIPLQEAKRRNAARESIVRDQVMDKIAANREPILPDEVHTLYSVDESMEMRSVFGTPRLAGCSASPADSSGQEMRP